MKKKIIFYNFALIILFAVTGCGKDIEETIVKCNDGYHMKNGVCTKFEDSLDAIVEYSCDEGYNFNEAEKTCVKVEEKKAKIDNPCPSGYKFANDKCTKKLTTELNVNYTCPNGTTLNGTRCQGTSVTQAKVTKSCPSGYMKISESATKCVRYTGVSYNSKTGNYYCIYQYFNLHVLEDGSMVCWYIGNNVDEKITYSCNSGTLNGDQCVTNIDEEATKNVSCPNGYQVVDGSCVRTETTKVTGKYYCDSGYDLINGTTCQKTIVDSAKKSYSCETGYEFVDNKCFKFLDNSVE